MLFMVRFTDHPDRLAVRQAHTAGHAAWLAEHADQVRIGGPLRQDPDGAETDLQESLALNGQDPKTLELIEAGKEVNL